MGAKTFPEGIANKSMGAKTFPEGIANKSMGAKTFSEDIPDKSMGAKTFSEGIADKSIGAKTFTEGIAETSMGAKSCFEALSDINMGTNSDDLLYPIFEQGLIEALNQFIKSGDQQHSLYAFYAEFMKAVAEKNSSDEKARQAAANLPLEQTHILPKHLPVNGVYEAKLKVALGEYLPYNAGWELRKKVAVELLMLYNAQKATSKQLLEFIGVSTLGHSKHLTNLKKYGLIKSEPPLNYVLTEKSKHLLLKTFGTPKNEMGDASIEM
jgi:hypothetical protein